MKSFAHLRGLALATAIFLPAAASGQAITGITGTFSGSTPTETNTVRFRCSGLNPCVGTYDLASKIFDCSNTHRIAGQFILTGLTLAAPGPISGTAQLKGIFYDDHPIGDGTCVLDPPPYDDLTINFTGTWNGTTATITFAPFPPDNLVFAGTLSAETYPQAFPMTVTASIADTATVAANFQPRPQDAGTTASTYVFAVAPQTMVRAASVVAKDMLPPLGKARRTDGGKDDVPVPCVLAQLNAAGQLQAVSASSLQAFVTGVLSAQGNAVSIVNGVATVTIAGATFYLGYGTSAQSMLSNGINRNVITVPGARECKPAPPQTGWWWNPNEGGRGYSIEVQANHIFYAAFLYDNAGRSSWNVATGTTSLDGALFTGELLSVANGQTLGGAYRAPSGAQSVGAFTLAFNDAKHGTMVWPGGTVAIERFDIVPNGLNAAARANQPETGWWWNPAESGRGFFIEWQDGVADLAGYMYDDQGNPVWYLSVQQTPNITAFSGNWWLYGGGQSLTGAYKPASRINDNVAPVTISFTSATTATMTLPNGRTTALQRHRF